VWNKSTLFRRLAQYSVLSLVLLLLCTFTGITGIGTNNAYAQTPSTHCTASVAGDVITVHNIDYTSANWLRLEYTDHILTDYSHQASVTSWAFNGPYIDVSDISGVEWMISSYPTSMSTGTDVVIDNIDGDILGATATINVYLSNYPSLTDEFCGQVVVNPPPPPMLVELSEASRMALAVDVAAEVNPVHVDDSQLTQYAGMFIVCFIGWQFIKLMRLRKHD